MNPKNVFILCALILLPACAATPKHALLPEDVPGLYTQPAQQTAVSAAGVTAGDDATQAAKQLSEQPQAMVESELASEAQQAVATDKSGAVPSMDAVTVDETGRVAISCSAITDEIKAIDAGLGSAAAETPPVTPPGTLQKTGRYVYELVFQTAIGPLQPLIQTKRAIFDDNEKERRSAEALERGTTRRAYLLGYASAADCALEE